MKRVALALVLSLAACREPAPPQATPPVPGTRTTATPAITQRVFGTELVGDWEDHGWAHREPGLPLKHHFTNFAGWNLVNDRLTGTFGGLTFRYRVTPPTGDFLEVRLDSETADLFPRVRLTPSHRVDLADGWHEVFVSMLELNPEVKPFNHLRLRAAVALPDPGLVEFADVGFTNADSELVQRAQAALETVGLPAAFSVDCTGGTQEISPLIYGIAGGARGDAKDTHQWKLGATTRRWGGNPATRYNWELGNAWNTGADYFFENVNYASKPDYSWREFLDMNRDRKLGSAITLPTLGWVAKDTKSVSFPKHEFPPQQAYDPEGRGAGNGVGKDGKPLEPFGPVFTSVPATPEFVARWVKAIREHEKKRGESIDVYFLDNEPTLWNDTHRDVHPEPTSYDELLEKTVTYAAAVKKVDPDALIAGPSEWGWNGYLYSAVDVKAGLDARPDRKKHGDTPLIEWWLEQVAAHEKKTGKKLLDVLDLHFYPQGRGLGVGTDGKTDPDTNALRIRSTRALWDPRYPDESWIKEPVRLIPRMREWVDQHHPGLKLSIGEYNFGAETHPSGGLALAEALGRFGQEGLWAAWYWTYPPEGSPAFWAFRAYRDFDGEGGHFEDWSMPTTAPRDASLFAARNGDGTHLTLVALNFSPTDTLDANLNLKGCAIPEGQRVFTYSGDPRGFLERQVPLGKAVRLPPYAMTVIELTLPKK